jgi:hypothetical protein
MLNTGAITKLYSRRCVPNTGSLRGIEVRMPVKFDCFGTYEYFVRIRSSAAYTVSMEGVLSNSLVPFPSSILGIWGSARPRRGVVSEGLCVFWCWLMEEAAMEGLEGRRIYKKGLIGYCLKSRNSSNDMSIA